MKKPFRAATRSPVALARTAYRVAKAALPAYSSPFSRRDFTQPQLYACLALMEFCRTDFRGIISYLEDFSELRQVLDLKDKVPHYSTLCRAKDRLGKAVPLDC
jgi:hypothetical protein